MSVELDEVVKRHGSAVALDHLALQVATGELVALIGPSGSGKTTALRVIAGLEASYEGVVRIDGRDVSAIPARERQIGFVFQGYALFRHMTVAENIAFGLRVRPRLQRPTRAAIQERVADLLDSVRLPGLGGRYPDQLSGGQRQRVALARALATDPSVLLLDEPFGALDPPVRKEMRRALRTLHDRLGLTTVLVTHDRDEAFEVSDRVAVLGGGRIQQIGTPDELDGTPANAFVFEFLGECQHIPGQARAGVFYPDTAALGHLPTVLSDGPALAMIRPHEIGLRPGGQGGRVVSVQHRLGASYLTVDVAGHLLEAVVSRDQPPMVAGQTCAIELGLARLLSAVGPCSGSRHP